MLQQFVSYVDWDHVMVAFFAASLVLQFINYSWALIQADGVVDGIKRSTFWLGTVFITAVVLIRFAFDGVSGDLLVVNAVLSVLGVTLSVIGGLFRILGGRQKGVTE